MIRSKKELKFYIMADMMMNRGKFRFGLRDSLKHLIFPDYIMQFLISMRHYSYIIDNQYTTPPPFSTHISLKNRILGFYHYRRFRRLGLKLGFSIGPSVFGYGLLIPHFGTIVVGANNKIGNYAVLHTCTCIHDKCEGIGDALYLASGAMIMKGTKLGDNVSVGANSYVNKSFDSNLLIAGLPAKSIKHSEAWYIRDGIHFSEKVRQIEELRKQMGLFN